MTNDEFLINFRIAFPELSEAPDERLLYFFKLAKNSMSESVWAKQFEEGVLNLVAHMLVIKYGLNGNGSPINTVKQETTSKTVGKLSKGMGSVNSGIYTDAGDYASTVYGRRYWELMRMIRPTGMYVSGFSLGGAGTFSR